MPPIVIRKRAKKKVESQSIFCGMCSPARSESSISYEVINQTVDNPIKLNPNDGDVSEYEPEIESPKGV